MSERLLESTLGALELLSVYVGCRLGLYDGLRDDPLTAEQLAGHTGIDLSYTLEWLAQQVMAGFVEATADGRYALRPEHADLLPDHEALAALVIGVARALPDIIEAQAPAG